MAEVERGCGGIDADVDAYPLTPHELANLLIRTALIYT
jgi:hypothetical protein